MEDVNWALRSEVKRARMPKHEIQVEIKAPAQDSAVMEVNGHCTLLEVKVVTQNKDKCFEKDTCNRLKRKNVKIKTSA